MFDITGFLNRNFDEIIPAKDGLELRVNCPSCADHKHHLWVNTEKQTCHCFKCGYSAGWIRLVMDVMGCEYYQALGELYHKPRMVDYHSQFGGKQVELIKEVGLPDGFTNLLTSDTPDSRRALAYIRMRGFTDRHISYHNIGVATSVPNRLIIPIEKDYWQARRLYEWMEPKYLNPESDAGDAIFNSQALELYEEVVICEGAFSAMAIGENSVALIGKECPDAKFKRLASAQVSSYILAVEQEARKEMGKLADKLNREGKIVTMWYYEAGYDPAENDGEIIVKHWDLKTQIESKLGG